mmetsp:Transcript_29715/g.54809  ORF Transcript_29715/g.54809 Transcript_29715/m.54809 type:complete len:112 (+) Transcript_29715:659-994(+)
MTDPFDWKCIKGRTKGRVVKPLPYTGDSEEFGVNITDEELAGLKDANGDILFYKVMEWCLPRFDREIFWEWQAARMRNYMVHLSLTTDWKPKYYNLSKGKVIVADHVARFF